MTVQLLQSAKYKTDYNRKAGVAHYAAPATKCFPAHRRLKYYQISFPVEMEPKSIHIPVAAVGMMQNVVKPPLVVAGMPMYNEEETIGTVVTKVLRHVD